MFYGSFAAGAGVGALVVKRPDVVFATSPPLPGALSVALAASWRRVPFVLDVRDLWPAAAEALGEVSNSRLIAVLERSERWLYSRAYFITATTRPFCDHIDTVAARSVSVHLPNGANDALMRLPIAPLPTDGCFTVGYAGNLGIAQGLGIVLDAAEALRNEPVRFVLIGDGPLSLWLREERDRRGLGAVEIRPGIPAPEIGQFLQNCNALLIPLRDHPVLHDFIPSKLYDAMAAGRPTLVAAPGEALALASAVGCGIEVKPEDGIDLARKVRHLREHPDLAAQMAAAGRLAAPDYARSQQVERLERVLIHAATDRESTTS